MRSRIWNDQQMTKEHYEDIPDRPLLSCSGTNNRIVQPCVVHVVPNSEENAGDKRRNHQREGDPVTTTPSCSSMIYSYKNALGKKTNACCMHVIPPD